MTQQIVVLITGASSGIGRATAELLNSRGYRVFGTARNPANVAPISGVELLPLDVRDDASVDACVKSVLRQAGRIDVLINNAGYAVLGAVEETSPSEAQALFDTNVFGVLRMVRAVLPVMRSQGFGRIVNTSSILGFLPGPFIGLYASTKHALEGLSETLDHEVRDFGIRVALVEPNFTNTQLDANTVHASQQIEAYAAALRRVSAAIIEKIKSAPGPETVAAEILRAIEEPYRMRRPVGFEARLLRRLRRFMPAGPVDRSIRTAFALT
jgi:NAD(P)-dependent dehydrogenase (short-subunit alcohol dehydrogenase family)